MNIKKFLNLSIPLVLLIMAGCSVEPKPIAYGTDSCHFCRMTIVDKQHGAEIVTSKGKVYKFDAVECMLNHIQSVKDPSKALFLVNGYTQPGELIEVSGATFVISEGIPSPMGAYLTAFASEQDAREALALHGGEMFSWQQLRIHLNK